jgi:hypothetical protein
LDYWPVRSPLLWTEEWDTTRQGRHELAAYLLAVVSMSFVMSALTNGSGGSVLLAILGHNGVNWALFAVGALPGRTIVSNWPGALGMALLAVIAIATTRGRLGLRTSAA